MIVLNCWHLVFVLPHVKWQGGVEIFQVLYVFFRDYAAMPIFAM